jgi:hypothetical protein
MTTGHSIEKPKRGEPRPALLKAGQGSTAARKRLAKA